MQELSHHCGYRSGLKTALRLAELAYRSDVKKPKKTELGFSTAKPQAESSLPASPQPQQQIQAPISLGELIDKITILQIKTKHLQGASLENVGKELAVLQETLDFLDLAVDPTLIQRLKEINANLWQIEDYIRCKERTKDFGEDFICLAREVYQQNDLRAQLKKEINTTYGSALTEEKSYQDY